APAEVALEYVPRYLARVRIALSPPDRRCSHPSILVIEFGRQEAPAWHYVRSRMLDAGAAIGSIDAGAVLDFDDDLDAPSGTLTWTGTGLIAGSAPFSDLNETTRTPIDARIELDPAHELANPPPSHDGPVAADYTFRVVNPGEGRDVDATIHVL